MTVSTNYKNIVVVGGSYVGLGAARNLMEAAPSSHRVLMIEPNSHFNHLFALPRCAVVAGFEEKAFIPYSGVFGSSHHCIINGRALSIHPDHLEIDRQWEGSHQIPFEYLVIATGTRLAAPSMIPFNDKSSSVRYLQAYQRSIQRAKSVAIVGGGAVGVQMALDIKELAPEKEVTVIHSRQYLMPQFHHGFHDLIKEAFDERGVRFIPQVRVKVPPEGFPDKEGHVDLDLNNGDSLTAERVILATGQRPNNSLLRSLPSSPGYTLINQDNGFIRVRPTLQLLDVQYPRIFAVGDIADTGSHKAARPGAMQAAVVAQNIRSMIAGDAPTAKFEPSPPGIHLSLGIERSVIFRNPNPTKGIEEPVITEKMDGEKDMGVNAMWSRLNIVVKCPEEYKL